MNELDLLTTLRADVPDLDPATEHRVRFAVLDRAHRPRLGWVGAALARIPSGGVVGRPPAGRRRLVRVGVAVAAVAAVLATGIAVTGLRSGDSVPIGATAAAAEVLDRAAAAAAKAAPAPVPGPGQVLYRRETGGQPVGTMGGGRDQAHLCASVHETWLPADPAVHAAIRRTDGIVVRSGTGDPTAMPRDPACSYDSFSDDIGPVPNGQLGGPDLRTLSTDPRTLYRQAREQGKDGGDNPDEGTFMALLDLARSASPYRSPRMTAAIYRALAYVPGVQLVGPGRDLLGRPGVVVGRTEPDRGSREEVIFDPSTGLMLGRRETVTDPGRVAELPIRGAVLWQSVITSAVVDRVGQRPSP